jgi:putative ABC transport system permease protein
MIINNLRLSIRHLSRQKINTALHIIGLTLGVSICLLIGLLLRYEWSFDRYHSKADRIYRVTSEYSDASNTVYHFSTPIPLAESLRTGVTGIENTSLAHPLRNDLVEASSGKPFVQKDMLVVDPEILDIFDIDVIAGNGRAALRKPYHALLTETTAKKFFGNENPLGKSFRFNNEFNIIVGGVVKDQPANTSLPFSVLLSFVENKQFLGLDPNNWSMIQGNSTFVILRKGSGLEDFGRKLKSIADKKHQRRSEASQGYSGCFSSSGFEGYSLFQTSRRRSWGTTGQHNLALVLRNDWLSRFGARLH